jgi:hypothetical protein
MIEKRLLRTIFTGNKVTELRNLNALACNIKCKKGTQMKKTEPILEEEQELFCR